MSRHHFTLGCGLLAVTFLAGCGMNRHPGNPPEPTTRPKATDIDPAQATPDYWYDKPAVASASFKDFYKLFNAAERVARNHYFQIDQRDPRTGLLITTPETTKQFFEIWRNDSGTAMGTLMSSLATHRRTLRYEFVHNPDNTYTVSPKVLVERYSTQGQRVTNSAQAGLAFTPAAEESDPNYQHYPWDAYYWYPVGRDTALEKKIAHSIQSRLK
ncbi:MAG TPA: hypothetical protein VFE58_05525 [Tepidisphaeraceae bacterium]|jgi:hypothetical protein|nr:hypothetical protein [Tepidisphaeraceae bacterium]